MRSLGFNPDDTLPKTFDLERVEVLRGPQGTLFGAGSEGGTVRYILAQPSVTKDSTYARGEVSFTQGGEPSYEAGVRTAAPLIDSMLGFRASVWYRYDGGWIDRVDPTTDAVTDKNSTASTRVRGAPCGPCASRPTGLHITPSMMYQNSRKHDESTYWPAYSDPAPACSGMRTPGTAAGAGRVLPAGAQDRGGHRQDQLVSNTSYYHRKEITAYQGTVYDLAYYQSLGWSTTDRRSAAARRRRLPCRRAPGTR